VKKISIAVIALFMLAVIAIAGCAQVPQVKAGDTVQVNYTGKLSDGTVFDSSAGKAPLEFTMGGGKIIPGFEKAVLGMKVGEKKTVTIAPADAYGLRQENMVMEVPRTQFSKEITPEVGMELESTRKDGSTIVATITKVTDTSVTLDANHPLAGKALTFDIELVKIVSK
jgi:peptidylprolyl isomerase